MLSITLPDRLYTRKSDCTLIGGYIQRNRKKRLSDRLHKRNHRLDDHWLWLSRGRLPVIDREMDLYFVCPGPAPAGKKRMHLFWIIEYEGLIEELGGPIRGAVNLLILVGITVSEDNATAVVGISVILWIIIVVIKLIKELDVDVIGTIDMFLGYRVPIVDITKEVTDARFEGSLVMRRVGEVLKGRENTSIDNVALYEISHGIRGIERKGTSMRYRGGSILLHKKNLFSFVLGFSEFFLLFWGFQSFFV
jgi:hypothetical protein